MNLKSRLIHHLLNLFHHLHKTVFTKPQWFQLGESKFHESNYPFVCEVVLSHVQRDQFFPVSCCEGKQGLITQLICSWIRKALLMSSFLSSDQSASSIFLIPKSPMLKFSEWTKVYKVGVSVWHRLVDHRKDVLYGCSSIIL